MNRIQTILSKAKADKGPFFIARLALRLTFDPGAVDVPDTEANVNELLKACKELGYEPKPQA